MSQTGIKGEQVDHFSPQFRRALRRAWSTALRLITNSSDTHILLPNGFFSLSFCDFEEFAPGMPPTLCAVVSVVV